MNFLASCKKTQNDLTKMNSLIDELEKEMKIKHNSVLGEKEENKLDNKIESTISIITEISETVKKWISTGRKKLNQ